MLTTDIEKKAKTTPLARIRTLPDFFKRVYHIGKSRHVTTNSITMLRPEKNYQYCVWRDKGQLKGKQNNQKGCILH